MENKYTVHVEMSDPRFDGIANTIRKSYPKSCILWIEQIDNSYLSSKFELFVASAKLPYTIMELFHGTKEKYVNSIIVDGFKLEQNKTSAYGIGTYLSPNCLLAMGYTDAVYGNELSYVFLCDVLVGRMGTTRPSQPIDRREYDCSVDSLTHPSIFCIPDNDMIIPKYLIVFHKNPM